LLLFCVLFVLLRGSRSSGGFARLPFAPLLNNKRIPSTSPKPKHKQPTFTFYQGARRVETFTGARADLLKATVARLAAGDGGGSGNQ
jgi:hypothetical protein